MKDKIVTLKNGKEYLIVDTCVYNEDEYCLACEVINKDNPDNFRVLKIVFSNNKKRLQIVEDNNTIKMVCNILNKNF